MNLLTKHKYLFILILVAILAGGFVVYFSGLPSFVVENFYSREAEINTDGNPLEELTEEQRAKYVGLYQKGREAQNNKQFTLAKSYFEQALAISTDSNLYLNLSAVYQELEEYENAFLTLERYLKEIPTVSAQWIRYANLAQGPLSMLPSEVDRIYRDAINVFRGIGFSTGLVNIYTNYSRFLNSVGQCDGAILFLQEAEKLDPERSEIYQAEIETIVKKCS